MKKYMIGLLALLLVTLSLSGCVELLEAIELELEQQEISGGTVHEEDPQDTAAEQQEDIPAEAPSYAIGDTGPAGGIVFYVEDDTDAGWVYLECAQHGWYGGAIDPKVQWGAYGYLVGDEAAGDAPGSGLGNSDAILSFHEQLSQQYPDKGIYAWDAKNYDARNNGSLAAMLCRYADLSGFDDWYLPSEAELSLMRENLYKQGFAGIEPDIYWSSTEADEHSGMMLNIWNNAKSSAAKYRSHRVRPIRRFTEGPTS